MKNWICIALAFLLMLGTVNTSVEVKESAVEPVDSVEYKYKVMGGGTAMLTGVSDERLEVMNLPAEVDGYKVTSVDVFAFGECMNVLSINIPEGIKRIESNAFANAFDLQSVSIPDSLEYIGPSAFRSKKLTEIKVSPDHPVFAVENEALIDKRDMTLVRFLEPENYGTYVVASGIRKIAENAFEFARVSSILIPDSVEVIGDWAFTDCENLGSINIQDNVTEIGTAVFDYCGRLTSIQISPDHPVFEVNGRVIVKKANKEIIAVSGAVSRTYVVPEDILAISDGAFQGCRNLKEIYIPATVQTIGNYAFPSDCVVRVCEGSAAEKRLKQYDSNVRYTALSPEDFAEGVAKQEKEKAEGVQEDIPINWRGNGRVCGNYHYQVTSDNTAQIYQVDEFIKDGNIPAELDGYKVTSIAGWAFSSCGYLEKVVIPEGVTSLGYGAFDRCSKLETIVIPDSLVTMDHQPFYYCQKLKNIEISPDHPVFEIENGMLINKNNNTLVYLPEQGNEETFTVPEGINTIADCVFENCKYTSIILPDSVRIIGSHAFSDCVNLKELVIPEGVISIGNQAVFGCEKLESITIPDSMEEIGEGIWGSNKALKNVVISPAHRYYEMIDHLLVDKRNMVIVAALNDTPAKYEIPEGIQEIGFLAFQGCDNLTELVVPEGVTRIGMSAFSGCSKLCKVTLPESVKEIADDAFQYSYELTIVAKEGTEAERFCKAKGYRFERSSNN